MSETTRRTSKDSKVPDWVWGALCSVGIGLSAWAHAQIIGAQIKISVMERTDMHHDQSLEKLNEHLQTSQEVQQQILIEMQALRHGGHP